MACISPRAVTTPAVAICAVTSSVSVDSFPCLMRPPHSRPCCRAPPVSAIPQATPAFADSTRPAASASMLPHRCSQSACSSPTQAHQYRRWRKCGAPMPAAGRRHFKIKPLRIKELARFLARFCRADSNISQRHDRGNFSAVGVTRPESYPIFTAAASKQKQTAVDSMHRACR